MAFLGEHATGRRWAGSAVALAGTAVTAVSHGLSFGASALIVLAAMARMDVGRVTLSLYLVPAVAIVISLVWLGQVPGPVELAGGAVALAGVILASTRTRRPPPAPAAGAGVRTVEPTSVR